MTAPRLYLTTPLLQDAAPFAPALAAALAEGDIAAVLVRLADGGERTLIDRIKALAGAVQGRGAALLLDGRPELVARAGADGAHLTGVEALNAALPMLKPGHIAGAGGLRSRHDAMLAGETEADYVMFGEPDRRGGRPPLAEMTERVQWWAELFQPPCIGYAEHADEIRPLAEAGTDFVALGDWIWTQAGGAERAVKQASASLAAAVA